MAAFEKHCPACDTTYKLAQFRVNGRYQKTCKTCYQREQKRLKAQKKRQEQRQESVARELQWQIAKAREKIIDDTLLPDILKQIAKERAVPAFRVRRYQDNPRPRAMAGMERQSAKLRYLDALSEWVTVDAQRADLKPYAYYRGNTYLLWVHGLRPTYDPMDRQLMEGL